MYHGRPNLPIGAMNDQDSADAASNLPPVISVGELSQAVKRALEDAFGYVRVRGEISQPRVPGSGHCYLRLKDESAVLDGVIWRGQLARLGLKPEEGMEVIVTGRLTTYAGRSTYQIVIERMELAGEGALLKMIEERRRRLAAEGLFDEDRKRPLPYLPDVVGVVTSPTGAVIRDILHRLADRFPRRVLLWPVRVQGEGAAAEIAAAIKGFNALAPGAAVPRPDVLIVARGGGSLEDLTAFNDEAVVREAAASAIPLISAVGHETDTTLIDFAADRRAPTPSAAAEMAVPVRAELLGHVLEHGRRLVGAMGRDLALRRQRVEGLGRGLPDPASLLGAAAQRLDDRVERLFFAVRGTMVERSGKINQLAARLGTPDRLLALARQALATGGRALDQAMRERRRGWRAEIRQEARVLAGIAGRLAPAWTRAHGAAAQRLTALAALMESASFERVLERGFVLVRDAAGAPVTTVAAASPGKAVTLTFHDGEAGAVISGARGAPGPRRPTKRGGNGRQGSLL